jgi:hypothetical protein
MRDLGDGLIRCSECRREVDEFVAIKERWGYWLDGRDLLPYCPACSEREFGGDGAGAARSSSGRKQRPMS